MDSNSNNNVSGIPNVSDIKFDDTPAESFDNLYGGSQTQYGINMDQNSGMAQAMSQNPGMVPNPEMTQTMPQNPGIVSNPGMAQVMSQNPSMVSNPGMAQAMPQNPSMVSNPGMAQAMSQNPGMVSNPGMAQAMPQNPNIVSNSGVINDSSIMNNLNVQENVEPRVIQPEVSIPVNSVQSSYNVSGVQNTQIGVNPGMQSMSFNNVELQQNNSAQPFQSQVSVEPVNNVVDANLGGASNIEQGAVMTANPINVDSNGVDLSDVNIDAERMQSIEEQLSKTSQYNPSDFQQEQISIPTDNQSGKGNSGLVFVIVLFILLGVAIAFMPQITRLIK